MCLEETIIKTHSITMYDYLNNYQSNVISLLSSYLTYSAAGVGVYPYYFYYNLSYLSASKRNFSFSSF